FIAAGSVVADALQLEELAPAEAELALAGCASRTVFRALKAQDHAFLRLGTHRTRSLSRAILLVRARRSQSNRISASRTFEITSCRDMTQTGTTIGTGGMRILTIIASLFLSTGFGAD